MPSAVVAPDSAVRPGRASPLIVGVIVWLTSELMFFGGLFATWFTLKANNDPNWPMGGVELDVARAGVFTVVLVSSSYTMHRCAKAAREGNRSSSLRWLVFTIVLGAAFLANLVTEYVGLDLPFDTDAFSTIFYMLTGFHGAHVFVGLIIMSVVSWVVWSDEARLAPGQPLDAAEYYWHFVDVVWIILFTVVYVLQ